MNHDASHKRMLKLWTLFWPRDSDFTWPSIQTIKNKKEKFKKKENTGLYFFICAESFPAEPDFFFCPFFPVLITNILSMLPLQIFLYLSSDLWQKKWKDSSLWWQIMDTHTHMIFLNTFHIHGSAVLTWNLFRIKWSSGVKRTRTSAKIKVKDKTSREQTALLSQDKYLWRKTICTLPFLRNWAGGLITPHNAA